VLDQFLAACRTPKDSPHLPWDLLIVDECHRGSANEEGNWRKILKYFDTATQIGMTATPRRNDNVDTYEYFGDPIYTYSLKQGIADGFLAPYKVIRIDLDKDINGWRPKPGQLDKYGHLIEDRLYNQLDRPSELSGVLDALAAQLEKAGTNVARS
jgi:type I restriction enzyme R subunit